MISLTKGNLFASVGKTTLQPFIKEVHQPLQDELMTAKYIVQKSCYVSRALQHNMRLNKCRDIFQNIHIKDDHSPVTIADFAVQALIIDRISVEFPTDTFIAEEDSEVVQNDDRICDGVVKVLTDATGEDWTRDRLIATLDKGVSPKQFDSDNPVGLSLTPLSRRVWVLDPIDGTKGFIRGAHFCVALALLIDGVPQLSVLGCPNLDVDKVLNRSEDHESHVQTMAAIDSPCVTTCGMLRSNGLESLVSSLSTGSMYSAVTGQGAFARSLSMPMESGFEVSVSSQSEASQSVLCAGYEKTHGNEALSERVARNLKLPTAFLRIDSQCKYSIVGSGGAEATLRLPPSGYREKIWDHAPGAHFVTEAGGRVTDLRGRPLNFSAGNLLDREVDGIVVSNGHLHDQIIQAVRNAKIEEEVEREANSNFEE